MHTKSYRVKMQSHDARPKAGRPSKERAGLTVYFA